MGKIAWLYKDDDEDEWVLLHIYDRYRSGQRKRIVYFDIEE